MLIKVREINIGGPSPTAAVEVLVNTDDVAYAEPALTYRAEPCVRLHMRTGGLKIVCVGTVDDFLPQPKEQP